MVPMSEMGHYCLPGHLAAMTAAEDEAAKRALKRTLKALTAEILPRADVARHAPGWLGLAVTGPRSSSRLRQTSHAVRPVQKCFQVWERSNHRVLPSNTIAF